MKVRTILATLALCGTALAGSVQAQQDPEKDISIRRFIPNEQLPRIPEFPKPSDDPEDPGTGDTPPGPNIQDLSRFYLSDQHIDDTVTGEKPHFHLRSRHIKLDYSCGEWCSGMPLGEWVRGGITKIMELPTSGNTWDRRFIVLKNDAGSVWELAGVRGNNFVYIAEKGQALAQTENYRTFHGLGTGHTRENAYVWSRLKAPAGNPGSTWANAFTGSDYNNCNDTYGQTTRHYTGPVQHGPFWLNDENHAEQVRRLISNPNGDLRPDLGVTSKGIVDELKKIPGQLRDLGFDIPGGLVLICRNEWLGAYNSGRLGDSDPNKGRYFGQSEFYCEGSVGNPAVDGNVALNKVLWEKRGPNQVVQRIGLFNMVEIEDGSWEHPYVVPQPHCGW